MNKTVTQHSYGIRIERVIRHIWDHLDQPLDLPALADVAALSPFHFHRVYRGFTGETVADTIRRLRLHRGAGDLVQGSAPIAAVAKRAGYGSVAAFSRAFRDGYGTTPAAYRASGRLVQPASSSTEKESSMYDVSIVTFEPLRLAGLRHTGSYMDIGRAFDRLYALAGARGLMAATTRGIGVYYDDPAAKPEKDLVSDACISVPMGALLPDELRVIDLAGGRHAVLHHLGPYAELEKAYAWLYRDWLPASGAEPANRPIFEEYLNNPRELPPAQWRTDVCLPLNP